MVIPHFEVPVTSLSNVVSDLNLLLRELSPSGKAAVVEIAESTNSCHDAGCGNHEVIGAQTLSMNASGLRFGQALKIIAAVCGLTCGFGEHGAVLARDMSHDWETQRDPTIGAEDLLAVAEAVFRYQCEHTPEAMGSSRTRYISVFEKDPAPEFLARFIGIRPPVRLGSRFSEGVGILLRLRGCRRVNASQIQVSGECFSDGLSFVTRTFTVARRDGAWVVVGSTVTRRG